MFPVAKGVFKLLIPKPPPPFFLISRLNPSLISSKSAKTSSFHTFILSSRSRSPHTIRHKYLILSPLHPLPRSQQNTPNLSPIHDQQNLIIFHLLSQAQSIHHLSSHHIMRHIFNRYSIILSPFQEDTFELTFLFNSHTGLTV